MIVFLTVAVKAKQNDDLNEPVFPIEDDDSAINTEENDKIFISHFCFMTVAIACKFCFIMLLLLHLTGLFNSGQSSYNWVRIFYSSSFVFLLISCSIQYYRWIAIVLRVEYYGGGLSKGTYNFRGRAVKWSFIFAATTIPFINFCFIFLEVYQPFWF
jgi:hypothetical protein